jgi:hypothetical protein
MGGLARLCRYYGSMKINGTTYAWDYVADKPVDEKEIPAGSERRQASERKRAELLKEQMRTDNSLSEPAVASERSQG